MRLSTLIRLRSVTRTSGGGELGKENLPLSFLPGCSGGPSPDCDGCRVPSKGVNIALDPLQSQSLVVKPCGDSKSQR